MNITLSKRIEIAKRITAGSAALKDWQCRTKHNKMMRELARKWMNGKGYIIATPRHLFERYGNDFATSIGGDADVLMIWTIIDSHNLRGSLRLEFVAV